MDYCLRANKLGYKGKVNENSFVFHFGGISRSAHEEMVGYEKHKVEDQYNNNRINVKYKKKLIVIHSGLAWEQWDEKSIDNGGIGGSETAACKMAENFVKLGYRVILFAPCESHVNKGVEWKNVDEWNDFIEKNYIDIVVISRYVQFFENNIRAGQKWLWIHDVFAMCAKQGEVDLVKKHYNDLTGIFTLSTWHKDFISQYHNIPKDKIIITGNGI